VVSWWSRKPLIDEWALIPERIAMTSFRVTLHTFGVLANRGLVSPQEIDDTFAQVFRDYEELPEEVRARLTQTLKETLADIKSVAAANRKGE